MNSRELALKVLHSIDSEQAYTNIELKKWLDSVDLPQVDKAFATEVVYGVVKWRLNIDYIIGQLSSVKVNKISPWIMNILRIGIYQINFLDKVPDSAAVNECVKLAKRYGHAGSVKFANGLLRGFIKKRDSIKYPSKNDPVKYISVIYSHPEWLVERWIEKFGFDFTESLCNVNNSIAPLSARVNNLRTSKEQLMQELQQLGVEVLDGLYFDDSININSNVNLSNLKPFVEGHFQIQDESSELVGVISNPKPGQTVIDVCAAPGGKSTHIAQLMKNEGIVHSRDIHNHKIKLIEENAKRLGIDIIKTKVFDASVLDGELEGKCDVVLVDAPCSGLGIIRRKPDIKWNRQNEDVSNLTNLQSDILETSSKYVKQDGVLIYSTCTIDDRENIDVIRNFLNKNPDFSLVDISQLVPEKLLKDSCKNGYIQLYPNVDNIDGFFISKMVKK